MPASQENGTPLFFWPNAEGQALIAINAAARAVLPAHVERNQGENWGLPATLRRIRTGGGGDDRAPSGKPP
jgi:hypothetical protein